MSVVKMKAKSVDEAVKSALEVLKTTRDQVEVRVIEQGEPGVLGVFGGKEAEVEVWIKKEVADAGKNTLQDILDRMGYVAQAYKVSEDDAAVKLEVKGDDISRIIGKDGTNLNAIQYLVNIIANKGKEVRKRISIDAGGYREKQERRIEKIAKEAAEEVKISGKEVELPPMNSKERRLVHVAIQNMTEVASHSVGVGSSRRVVIAPKN